MALNTSRSRTEQEAVARRLEVIWACDMVHVAEFDRVDYYRVRGQHTDGAVEIKCRHHERHKYPTVFLSLRKWLALQLVSLTFECDGLFVVQFDDELCCVNIHDIGVHKLGYGGRTDRHGRNNDLEPIIEVPVPWLQTLWKGCAYEHK